MSLAIGDPGGATARVALGGESCAGACDGFCVRSCSTRSFPTTAHLRCVGRGGCLEGARALPSGRWRRGLGGRWLRWLGNPTLVLVPNTAINPPYLPTVDGSPYMTSTLTCRGQRTDRMGLIPGQLRSPYSCRDAPPPDLSLKCLLFENRCDAYAPVRGRSRS